MTGPQVVVNPAVRAGQPQIKGIPVVALCDVVWAGESVDRVADDYNLTRADVLVGCWYAGMLGLPGERRKVLAATPLWRKRWGAWAEKVTAALWSPPVKYDVIPDPPNEEECS
jgi:uncharacterized protein (DUF433 family)